MFPTRFHRPQPKDSSIPPLSRESNSEVEASSFLLLRSRPGTSCVDHLPAFTLFPADSSNLWHRGNSSWPTFLLVRSSPTSVTARPATTDIGGTPATTPGAPGTRPTRDTTTHTGSVPARRLSPPRYLRGEFGSRPGRRTTADRRPGDGTKSSVVKPQARSPATGRTASRPAWLPAPATAASNRSTTATRLHTRPATLLPPATARARRAVP